MDNPYYEKAMMMRSRENTIYFASVNYSFQYPDSASSVINPQGECIAWQPYSKPGILVIDIDLDQATGLLAKRFKSELYC
jgi:predicted amidohydrolase